MSVNVFSLKKAILLGFCGLLSLTANAVDSSAVLELNEKQIAKSGLELPNPKLPESNIITGGQPAKADIGKLKQLGVTRIINLRGVDEFDGFDEAEAAEKAGIEYVSLPVSGREAVNRENAKKLHDYLNQSQGVSLVHCGSGNRVGALMAIKAAVYEGKSEQAAIEYGKSAGLTRLENRAKEVIQQNSTQD